VNAGTRGALVAAGFDVRERGRHWWLGFPDGFDAEIVPLDAPIDSAALVALATRRTTAVAAIQRMFGNAGWGIVRNRSGFWELGRRGTTSSVSVGWTLTERLRDREPLPALQAHLAGWFHPGYEWSEEELAELREQIPDLEQPWRLDAADLALQADAPIPDTDELWLAHLRRESEILDNAVEMEPIEPDPEVTHAVSSAFAKLKDDSAGDNANGVPLAEWAPRILQAQREELRGPESRLWRLVDPLWWHQGDTWITAEALRDTARHLMATYERDDHALGWLIRLGDADAKAKALALWDRLDADGELEVEEHQYLAPHLRHDRAKAAQFVFAADDWHERVQRALDAGGRNALHAVRAGFEKHRAAWRAAVPGSDDAWREFCDMVEALRFAGGAAPDVLDPSDARELQAAFLDLVCAPTEDACAVLGELLAVGGYCGWDDVLRETLAQPAARAMVIAPMPGFTWARPAIVRGLLAISRCVPGPDALALVEAGYRALPPIPESNESLDRDIPLAVAIAWHRCRTAS
jgi:hypothetical protein